MSTFVLAPPDSVDVISFFITARFAGQSDRSAFLAAVAEQAAALLGEESTVGARLGSYGVVLDLLARAAQASHNAGRRLVLLVDGIDEDRGIVADGNVHHIAALLPARPGHGMRVIVAGRPNPPIPVDVLGHHPIRDPFIVRTLAPSLAATTTRRIAGHELGTFLTGDNLQQTILALLTASGGGLSARDLHDLSGHELFAIERILDSVTGRTFTTRPARWSSEEHSDIYILGHEELQNRAADYLAARLPAERHRIHVWADSYIKAGWPPSTPEYLIDGYLRLLQATGDTKRMIALALDHCRHDRMLDLSGGDVLAFTELALALNEIADDDSPDLVSAGRLARHRNQLEARNARIPPGLPALWVRAGRPIRGEALARSINDPTLRLQALAALSRALADKGQDELAEDTARGIGPVVAREEALSGVSKALCARGKLALAERIAQSITLPRIHDSVLAQVADAYSAAGRHDHAARIARALTLPQVQGEALRRQSQALAAAGDHDLASRVAVAINNPRIRAEALSDLSNAAHADGHPAATSRLVEAAGFAAREIKASHERVHLLAALARTLGSAGNRSATMVMAAAAEQDARAAGDLQTLVDVSQILFSAGYSGDAMRIADDVEQGLRAMLDQSEQLDTLSCLAHVYFTAGRDTDAARVLEAARQAALSKGPEWDPSYSLVALVGLAASFTVAEFEQDISRTVAVVVEWALRLSRTSVRSAREVADLSRTLADAGHYDHAEQIARTIDMHFARTEAISHLAQVVGANGNHVAAERLAHTIDDAVSRAEAFGRLARKYSKAGDFAEAERLARAIPVRRVENWALQGLAQDLADARKYEAAEDVIRVMALAGFRAMAEAALARAHMAARHFSAAERIADGIGLLQARADVLTGLGIAVADDGDQAGAARIAAAAEMAARTITRPELPPRALCGFVLMLTGAGNFTQAERLIDVIANLQSQTEARIHLARALADAQKYSEAERIVSTLSESEARDEVLDHLSRVLSTAGIYVQGERVARGIVNPYSRAMALVVLAKALAAAGKQAEGVRVMLAAELAARAVSGGHARAEVLAALVTAFAYLGNYPEAERIALSITNPFSRGQAMAVLTRASPGVGRTENSAPRADSRSAAKAPDERAARAITDPRVRSEAMLRLAQSCSNISEATRFAVAAQQAAEDIANPSEKIKTLTHLAKELELWRTLPEARRSVVRAWMRGTWYEPLAVLRYLDPRALEVLAEDVINQFTAGSRP